MHMNNNHSNPLNTKFHPLLYFVPHIIALIQDPSLSLSLKAGFEPQVHTSGASRPGALPSSLPPINQPMLAQVAVNCQASALKKIPMFTELGWSKQIYKKTMW